MRPITPVAVTGVKAGAAIPVDHQMENFNLGIAVDITGTITYNVEYTMDDLSAGAPATWYPMTAFSAKTAATQGNFTQPCTAIRVNNTAGTGSTTLRMVQAGH